MGESPAHLLEVVQLTTQFYTEKGTVTAVDGVSFHVDAGEFIGIVGESGCGKSVTSQSILRLFDERRTVRYGGAVNYNGHNLLALPQARMQEVRGDEIAMIFQDPMSSLNPVFTIGAQIMETLRQHRRTPKREARSQAVELLRRVGIPAPEKRVDEYPHQLSGGMRQRVMIAIALACQPTLLIADEPTTALDVTIQAQILDLLHELNNSLGMSVILITHDLGVVAEVCDRVLVMYLGQVVEEGTVEEIFARPAHPYTISLMRAIPHLDSPRDQELPVVEGSVPSLHNVPPGCRFAGRCTYADSRCRTDEPPVATVGEGHTARCWHANSLLNGAMPKDELLKDELPKDGLLKEGGRYAAN